MASPKRLARKHRSSGGGGSSLIGGAAAHSQIIAPAIGGFAVGKIEASGVLDNLPSLPLLGKKGTAALVLHLVKPNATGYLRDVKIALATLCGYELAKDGVISGAGY